MKVISLQRQDLKPYDRNAKLHPQAQIDKLAASIQAFGFNNPVLVDKRHEIIAGHGRVLAAKQLRLDTVPCVVLDHLSDEQKRAFMLADNRIAEQGGWDDDLLSMELSELKSVGVDLELTGFSDQEWQKLLPEKMTHSSAGDDVVPDLPDATATQCQRGDVWQLDDHRLMCGDSTAKQDMMTLVNSRLVDMVWTDPPYNVNYQGGTADKLSIVNDDMSSADFKQFLTDLFTVCHGVCKPGCPIYVAYADSENVAFRQSLTDAHWKLSQTLIWVKQHFKLSRQDYHWRHEPIIYGWKEGKTHAWYGGRKQTSIMDAQLVLDNLSHDDLLALAKSWQQVIASTVIKAKKPNVSVDHPTMKPVALILNMLVNSSQAHDLILDPCAGSGSTLIAAEKSHRTGCMMEIDPRYCDVIIRRWQDFTGGQAVHADTGALFNKTPDRRSPDAWQLSLTY